MVLLDYLDWISEVNWWITLLAAIPLSIIANILTPIVLNLAAKRSIKKSHKRTKELQNEIDTITNFVNNKESLYFHLTRSFLIILILLGLGNAIYGVGTIFYLMAIIKAWNCIQLTKKVQYFDDFRTNIESQIAEIKSKTTKKT